MTDQPHRTHTQIIAVSGPTKFGRAIDVDPNLVFAWVRNDSIPGAYWERIASEGLAELAELAAAAAVKRPKTEAA